MKISHCWRPSATLLAQLTRCKVREDGGFRPASSPPLSLPPSLLPPPPPLPSSSESVGSLLLSLAQFNFTAETAELQTKFSELLAMIRSQLPSIWPSPTTTTASMTGQLVGTWWCAITTVLISSLSSSFSSSSSSSSSLPHMLQPTGPHTTASQIVAAAAAPVQLLEAS